MSGFFALVSLFFGLSPESFLLFLRSPSFPFIGAPTSTYPEWERGGTSAKAPRRKASSFRLGEVTGAVEKCGAHPTTRNCGCPPAPLRGPTGQPQRCPVRPPCLVLLPGQGGRPSASILATLSRGTRVKRDGTRALNGPTPPCQCMAGSDTRAWAAENVRMSRCQAARAH